MKYGTECRMVFATFATFCRIAWAGNTPLKRADWLKAYLSKALQVAKLKAAENFYMSGAETVVKARIGLTPNLNADANRKSTTLDRIEFPPKRSYTNTNTSPQSGYKSPKIQIDHAYRFRTVYSAELPPNSEISVKEQKTIITQLTDVLLDVGSSLLITCAKADQHARNIYKDRTSEVLGLSYNFAIELLLKCVETPKIWDIELGFLFRLKQDNMYRPNKTLHPPSDNTALFSVSSSRITVYPSAGLKREVKDLVPDEGYSQFGPSSSLVTFRTWAPAIGRSVSSMGQEIGA